MVLSIIPFFMHYNLYKKLVSSISNRCNLVWGEIARDRHPLSSSGAIPRLNYIEVKFGNMLTNQELSTLQKSKKLYYLSGVSLLLVFIGFVVGAFIGFNY